MLLRKSTTWHRGMPNFTDRARPLFSVTFGEEGSVPDPFSHNGGAVEFYANWFSTSRKGQIREWTFKNVPYSYSTFRFLRSIGSTKGYDS